MRIFEIMLETDEKIMLMNGCEARVVDRYSYDGEHQYDIIHVKTDNPLEDVRKIDSNETVWMMCDCFETGRSSYTDEAIWTCPFWEEVKSK